MFHIDAEKGIFEIKMLFPLILQIKNSEKDTGLAGRALCFCQIWLERETRRNHALTVEQQVMITLRFLASGSFLLVIGDTLGIAHFISKHMNK